MFRIRFFTIYGERCTARISTIEKAREAARRMLAKGHQNIRIFEDVELIWIMIDEIVGYRPLSAFEDEWLASNDEERKAEERFYGDPNEF